VRDRLLIQAGRSAARVTPGIALALATILALTGIDYLIAENVWHGFVDIVLSVWIGRWALLGSRQ